MPVARTAQKRVIPCGRHLTAGDEADPVFLLLNRAVQLVEERQHSDGRSLLTRELLRVEREMAAGRPEARERLQHVEEALQRFDLAR